MNLLSIFCLLAAGLACPRNAAAQSREIPSETSSEDAKWGIDRLEWLGTLEKRLEKGSRRPRCIGPLGCAMHIPEKSPCRKPPLRTADAIIDGVVPGAHRGVWVIAYRLVCSACYEGGTAHLALIRVDRRNQVRFLAKKKLRTKRSDHIPTPLEMVSEDIDDDGRREIIVNYGYVREQNQKCKGMADAASFVLLARPDKSGLNVLFHEQTRDFSKENQEIFHISWELDDVNDDGYPDLLLTRVPGQENTCVKGRGCRRRLTTEDAVITRMVRLYDDAKGGWSSRKYRGYGLAPSQDVACDVPLPDRPFAVVTKMYSSTRHDENVEKEAARLRASGFEGACTYRADDFEAFPAIRFVTIAGAYSDYQEAERMRAAVRRARFVPFVKRVYPEPDASTTGDAE